jgi:HEAT repeats
MRYRINFHLLLGNPVLNPELFSAMPYCSKLSLLTCALFFSLAARTPAQTTKPAVAPASRNWTGMIMTGLVVTSTIGGIAYSLGYGRGRNRSIDATPTAAVPRVVLSTSAIKFEQPDEAVDLAQASQPLSPEEVFPSNSVAIASRSPEGVVSETTRMVRVDIVTELIQDLQNPEPSKRRKAIWDLGQQGDSRAIQPMIDLMMDSDSSQRSLILAAISEIGIRTLKPVNRALMLSLQDGSSDVRKNGIRDVTRIYDLVGQVSQLLQHAASDPDPEVQETANWALTQLNRIRPLSGDNDLPRLPNGLNFKELESIGDRVEGQRHPGN